MCIRKEVITMGRTNVVLDDDLVVQCKKATGIKTCRALIDYALRELLRQESQAKVLELKGKTNKNISQANDVSGYKEIYENLID